MNYQIHGANIIRNPNLPPKPKYVKVNRVEQKHERMDKWMNTVDRVGKIVEYQLQEVCGFGDGVFYNISKAVLQTYPHKYQKSKGVVELKGEYAKLFDNQKESIEITTQPIEITSEWDSNLISIKVQA